MTDRDRCPVCQARFRDALTCSRCGADLRPLFELRVRAQRLRDAARDAIRNGDYSAAHALAVQSSALFDTGAAHKLQMLTAWLGAEKPASAQPRRPGKAPRPFPGFGDTPTGNANFL
jgi:predicted amidophosphoribosyltransferase